MPRLTIMSGIPGSGKTTWAKQNRPNATLISVDDYFTINGNYRWIPNEAHNAAVECMASFLEAVEANRDVVIDNTNSSVAEISPYYLVGCAYGYRTELVTCYCDPETAAARNIHAVPFDVCNKMHDKIRFRRLPMTWRSLEISHVGMG